MAAIILCALSVLHQISITAAAPTNAISFTPPISLTQVNAPTAASENVTSSTLLSTSVASFCARSALLKETEEYIISIPDTSTILDIYYCPDLLIDPDAMDNALHTAYAAMSNHISAHGDGPMLPPAFDPYESPRVPGINCTVTAKSSNPSYHFTFQILENTFVKLHDFLYASHRFGSALVLVADRGVRPDFEWFGVVIVRPYGDRDP